MSGDPSDKRARPDDSAANRPPAQEGFPAAGAERTPIKVPPGILPGADDERHERSTAAKYAGVGLQFAAAILLFLWLGTWLDRRLGTEPLFLFLGVFLGAGGAFYGMYRRLMADLKRDEEAKKARKARKGPTAAP